MSNDPPSATLNTVDQTLEFELDQDYCVMENKGKIFGSVSSVINTFF